MPAESFDPLDYRIIRHSITMGPMGSLVLGRPQSKNWKPVAAQTVGPVVFGRLQVLFGTTDVTAFRGQPTIVRSTSDAEPFDDATAEIYFPQIGPNETLPAWMEDWANVTILLIEEDTTEHVVFRGNFEVEIEGTEESGSGTTVQCRGTIYMLDAFERAPELSWLPNALDLYALIANEFSQTSRPSLPMAELVGSATGITSYQTGSWDKAGTGYVQDLLTLGVLPDGSNQYTVMLQPGGSRVPELRLKDLATVHATYHTYQPGITHNLQRIFGDHPNVIYGEGVDNDRCVWRNSKYPMSLGAAPASPTVQNWKEAMYAQGWVGLNPNTNTIAANEVRYVLDFQRIRGLPETGTVNAATMAAAWQYGTITAPHFAPLALDMAVEPNLYGPSGGLIGPNPLFDPEKKRVEKHFNFGNRISKDKAVDLAVQWIVRDSAPYYKGTITAKLDPESVNSTVQSRFLLRAGMNMVLREHRGVDRLFHIIRRSVDWTSLTVTYDVSEKPIDFNEYLSAIGRDRDNHDPSRRRKREYRNSKAVRDQPTEIDCEAGGGVFPKIAVTPATWYVRQVPFSKAGEIARTDFTVSVPARFALGVFDRPITAANLAARASGNPLDAGYWDLFDLPGGTVDGLVIALGGEGEAGGFWPKKESDTDEPPLTGRLVDAANFYYESEQPPWLWVACWVESGANQFIQGKFFSAPARGS